MATNFFTVCIIITAFCYTLVMTTTNGIATDSKEVFKYNSNNNLDEKSNNRQNNAGDDVNNEISAILSNGDFENMRNLNFDEPLRLGKSLGTAKRAPNGFIGMRGKKPSDFGDDAFLDRLHDAESSEWQDALNSWLLVRNAERFKKAPSAFYGVRGKKFAARMNPYISLQELKHNLHTERIREGLLQDFVDRISLLDAVEKRAPAGFLGMRGKRGSNVDDDVIRIHQAFKRSPPNQMFLYGARGKKYQLAEFRNKFVGVRGKKNFASASGFTSKATAASEIKPF